MDARLPPGPNDHVFGMRTMSRMKADVLGCYTELQRRYGDCVSFRTGPYRLFVFFHPQQVHQVLVQQAKSLIRLPRVMQTFAQWNGNSLLIAEGQQWIGQRRLVQPAFQPRRLEHYGRTMVQHTRRLVDSWRASFDRQGFADIDIDQAMTRLTLSIICQTMFASDVADCSAEIGEAVSVLSNVAFHEMQAPVRWPRWVPTRWNRRKRWAIGVLDRVVWQFVRQRRNEGTGDCGDLLSMLLTAVDEESGGTRLDDVQIRDEAMTLMLAGHDTTSAGLDWFWYNIARFPEVEQRCHAELATVIGSRDPVASDVQRLEYLVATIKETLRLYPPAIGIFLRQATSDLRLGGFDVPRKSLITLSSYVTHRDARWFPDPERFDPERFLPDHSLKIPTGAYFPFGGGPRVCIGQSFALTEMVLIAAVLLQSCEASLVPGTPEPHLEVKMALRPRERLMLRMRPRSAPGRKSQAS